MATGFLKRGLTYLGLTDDGYDDDERLVHEERQDTLVNSYDLNNEEDLVSTRPVRVVARAEREQSSHVVVTTLRKRPSYSTSLSPDVHAVAPHEFADARQIADAVMAGQPVVVNLETADRELKRRIIDFCSGVVCGLGGGMERIASNVFLITPSDQELSADERRGA
jgi:FtsZ-interacting cell division protein YlmF